METNDGCLTFIAVVLYVIGWAGTGTIAFNMVEPKSFVGALLFLMAWGILGWIVQIVVGLLIAVLMEL